ncbi:MAG: CHAT domain-containing protein, partial [Bryobacteraceae bacterium]
SESPLDSAVILSQGAQSFKLYARDAAAIPLHAELVTISACRSAGAKMYAGEGLVGFSWAFLRAGARNVIAGLWDASDRATAGLMTRLYQEQRRGKNPAEALRAAKLAMLRGSAYRQPYYWAPFELFTRSAPFAPARVGASR